MKYFLISIMILPLYSCGSKTELEVAVITVSGIFDEGSIENTHRMWGAIRIGEFNYAVGEDNVTLHKIDQQNRVVHSVGGRGFGPAEFQRIRKLQHDGDNIYVFDNSARKVFVFDQSLLSVDEFTLKESVVDIDFTQPEVAYATHLSMDGWSLLRYDKRTFDLPDYLHIEATRRPEMGVAHLSVSNDIVLINHIFTNKSTLFHRSSNDVSTATFNYLDSRPPLRRVGAQEVPERPVWHGAALYDKNIIQLTKNDDKYAIVITDFSGNKLKRVDLSEELETAVLLSSGLYGSADKMIYFYPLHLLIYNDLAIWPTKTF